MCIIVYKEKNKAAKLDWDILETCFINNPDGAGYSLAYDNKLILRKGFMRFDDFKTSLENSLKSKKLVDCGLLLHFRITTHGGTSRENTHPFPIGEVDITKRKYKDLDCAIAMNGISLSNVGYKDKISDTMDNVLNLITPLYNMYGKFWNDVIGKQVFDYLGAKWTILDKDGTITSFGDFHTVAGWTYSNYSYLDYTLLYPKTNKCYNSYEDFEDEKTTYTSNYYSGYIDLGLEVYVGKVKDLDDKEVFEVVENDELYVDENNDLYFYDWEADDYIYMNNLVAYFGE